MTNTDYQGICRENAERFLKTAFVLDDMPEKVDRVIKQKVASLTKPSKGVPLTSSDDEGLTEIPETSLDRGVLIDMFMQKGIVCSIIQPEDKKSVSNLRDSLITAIENVDLPILDWNLFRDDGDTIVSILKHLIEDRSYPEGRVSLILIYTREPILGAMGRLQDEFNRRLMPEQDRDNVLAMKGLRIVLVDRLSIDEGKLPDLIIDEFSEVHQGILENGVMQAISEIREKTYHLLNRFPAKLDAPFLAHRAVLHNPEDSGNHAFELISSEIEALLIQSDLPARIFQPGAITRSVNNIPEQKLINTYLAGVQPDIHKIRGEIRYIIEKGLPEKDQQTYLIRSTKLKAKKKKEKKILSQLTDLLSQGDEVESDLNAEFSELFTFEHSYYDSPKQLTLGTLIYGPLNRKNPNYELCVLPYCDSERLKGKVSIPFLALSIQDKPEKKFDITINYNDTRIKLFLDYSPAKIIKHPFMPTSGSGGRILSDGGIFYTAYRSDYRWMGTLKREFALRIANRLGSEISQVGLNDSEWQRLRAK